MALTILLILAGLMGAAGVVLAAAGAHAAPTAGLDSAAYLLLFHATAILGAAAIGNDRGGTDALHKLGVIVGVADS